jgi:anti-repressor protein
LNNLTAFSFKDTDFRTLLKPDGEIWFVGVDICDILGLSNPTMAYKRLLDTEKTTLNRIDVGLNPGAPLVLISESGFYKLVMRSDKIEAQDFQNTVCAEILPQIRKTGSYGIKAIGHRELAEMVIAECDKNQALMLQTEQQQRQIKALLPQAQVAETFLASADDVPVAVFAKALKLNKPDGKRLEIGPNKMFKLLRDMGMLFKRDGYNLPKQEYVDSGIFRVNESAVLVSNKLRIVPVVRITPKGHDVLLQRIKKHFGLGPSDVA